MSDPIEVVIRPYQADDLEACRDLWVELTQHHRDIYDDQTIGGDDPGLAFDEHARLSNLAGLWVAERDGALVGMCGLLVHGGEAQVEPDEGQVEPIVVTSTLRSAGIGRRLLEHVIAEARGRGLRSLSIRPVARNVEAIQLFHQTGFRVLGHLDMFMDLTETGREWKSGISMHERTFLY